MLNDTQVDPEHPERPFSHRNLIGCLKLGAERFGWDKRNPRPGQVREGRWLIGMGVAAGFRNNLLMKSGARVRLGRDGIVTVETDMTDIGTGTYTIIGQTAAEMMGVPLDKVVVRLGDSDFPASSGSGGQWGANNSTAGVYAACVKLREAVAQKLGFNSADAVFADGEVRSGNRTAPLAEAARDGELIGRGLRSNTATSARRTSNRPSRVISSRSRSTRPRRKPGCAACWRSARRAASSTRRSARSQVIGAMTMGVGGALMEDLAVDKRYGFFVNHDLAGYEVPVHADIPHQEVIFMDETDPMSSPMKAKGVGELGICGVGAAIANAIHNATGIRVRDYPITLDKLLERMPETA